MKRIRRLGSIGILSLFLILALVSVAPVQAKPPQLWNFDAWYTFEPEWTGDITREDGSQGTLYFDVIEWRDLPDVQKFSGKIMIVWDDGESIEGTITGHVVWSTGEGVMNGEVTTASTDWAYLIGRNIHIESMITPIWTCYGVVQIN
ncbi:MAG: hypothetical protein ACFFED_17845 [Candidatus Thorarchaeota archaeon]